MADPIEIASLIYQLDSPSASTRDNALFRIRELLILEMLTNLKPDKCKIARLEKAKATCELVTAVFKVECTFLGLNALLAPRDSRPLTGPQQHRHLRQSRRAIPVFGALALERFIKENHDLQCTPQCPLPMGERDNDIVLMSEVKMVIKGQALIFSGLGQVMKLCSSPGGRLYAPQPPVRPNPGSSWGAGYSVYVTEMWNIVCGEDCWLEICVIAIRDPEKLSEKQFDKKSNKILMKLVIRGTDVVAQITREGKKKREDDRFNTCPDDCIFSDLPDPDPVVVSTPNYVSYCIKLLWKCSKPKGANNAEDPQDGHCYVPPESGEGYFCSRTPVFDQQKEREWVADWERPAPLSQSAREFYSSQYRVSSSQTTSSPTITSNVEGEVTHLDSPFTPLDVSMTLADPMSFPRREKFT